MPSPISMSPPVERELLVFGSRLGQVPHGRVLVAPLHFLLEPVRETGRDFNITHGTQVRCQSRGEQ